ncbi:heat shock protein Hsp20 [Gracilibacillus halophilus YIM-C55.5]|uniref:Heat shock protein Hsp20 n=1 Tax=Gracilibacillus halophilus YIM-C55.5 TaxID=1308866 RepID=N4WTL2_9BACI|nr:Hsp20/alpha crystallin family protein [Gracilibacillus halophilus]ENH97685.1 heat shock protein Hsp20 [Gracilibacillus halophilus YIM-C55.5]
MSESNQHKPSDFRQMSEDLLKKMDAFFHEKPSNNLLNTMDHFFQKANLPGRMPVDRKETDKEWIVTAELPGVEKDQIQLQLTGNQIRIAVDDDQETERYDESNKYYQKERRREKRERTISVPYQVDKATAKARLHHGVLEIRGPKEHPKNEQIDIL